MQVNTLRTVASVSCVIGAVKLLLSSPQSGQTEGLLAVILGVLLWILVELRERNRNEE